MFSADTGASFRLDISPDRLLIDSYDLDNTNEDRCYFAVFPQTQGRQDAWYLGNLILAEYYLVFDMDDYFNGRVENHIQIGFAKKNPAGITYEKHPETYYSATGIHEGYAA